jgi:hypothetical protein
VWLSMYNNKIIIILIILLSSTLCMGQAGVFLGGGFFQAAPSSGSNASLVQAGNSNCAATSCPITLTGVTLGDALWYCSSNSLSTPIAGNITDGGDTFTTLGTTSGTGIKDKCGYVLNTTLSGSVTITLTWTSGTTATTAIAGEVTHQTGLDASGVFQTNGATASLIFALPTGYTTAHANAIVFGYASGAGSSLSILACAACGGFAIPSNGSNISSPVSAVEYVANVANGTNLNSGSFTSGTSLTSISGIFAFY